MNPSRVIAALFGTMVMYMIYITAGCNNTTSISEESTDTLIAEASYVGEKQCQSCHEMQHADWKLSDHYLAMQPANDSTVLGDFNNATYSADGVRNKFFKKDGKFYLNTQGNDGNNHDYEVKYTFGHYPLQQYLIAFPGGRMQSARVSWDSRDHKWFHQYPGQKIEHKDWLHWSGGSQNWNTMCASCHSTNLQKNYAFEPDSFHTTWNEINVSCESCHGPGSKHLEYINSGKYKNGEHLINMGFVYSKDSSSQLQLNTCAPCHARKSEIDPNHEASAELLDDYIPQVISDEFYFPDGQINAEDYELGSFMQSKMFHKNVRCSNCHNPHSGKLKKLGNNMCLSCHQDTYNSESHHFHKQNTEGAQCVNCHMAAKTYMGNDHRRDHSFRIPRPDQSVAFGTPNACNGCHKEKSSQWASNAVEKWYGPARKYHFSDDLVPGSKLDGESENYLIKLLQDTLQPEIARATAVHYLGNMGTQQSANALLKVLNDSRAMVRYQALRALENFPSGVWQQLAYGCLTDRVRAVRIAAAGLYRRVPENSIPPEHKADYQKANEENYKYLQYQSDFSVGNVMLGDYAIQGGDHINAIKYYLRGLQKDSLMNYARLNLSAAYNSVGKNEDALKTLNDAAKIDPQNDRIFYNLGLLYYEMKEVTMAMQNFEKATLLNSQIPGLYYNYGLLLQQQEKQKEAEILLLKGFKLDPQDLKINFALSYFYFQQKNTVKAKFHAQILRQLDPANPQYQQLFNSLGI